MAARFLDRVGKGIRGAPRDALVADVTPVEQRGAAFGLRQSLDTIGAFLGPMLAIGLMLWLADDIRAVLWFAVVPAAFAVFVLIVAVRDPEHRPLDGPRHFPLARAELKELPAAYWYVVGVGAVLTLARFGEGFLVLQAQQYYPPRQPGYGYAEPIPSGHLPSPGECRMWYPGVPAGQQPPPFRC